MADNNPNEKPGRPIGLVLGVLLAAVAAVFILTGGQLGGVKEVKGDADMPPIASGATGK